MTQCPSCKNTVQPNSAFCPFCGSSLSQDPASPSSHSLDPDALPYDEELPFREYAPSSHTPPFTAAMPPTVAPAAEQTAGFVTAMPPAAFPLAEMQPVAAPLPRRASSIGTMALLGLLSLVLIISISGFAYYAVVAAPNDLHTQATGVAQTYLTAQARSTEQASTQAINKLLAMTPQALYSQVTSGTPIIDDPLTGPGDNVWFHYRGAGICNFVNNAYHIGASTPGGILCFALGSFFKDVAFQVEVTIVKGSRGGLLLDVGSSGDYSFEISQDGSYIFFTEQNDNDIVLRSGFNLAINTGLNQKNLLTVITISHHFYLYVNQIPLTNFTDDTYSSGQIGLQGRSDTNVMDVAFNNAKVWEI